jgi:hypothetical protein
LQPHDRYHLYDLKKHHPPRLARRSRAPSCTTMTHARTYKLTLRQRIDRYRGTTPKPSWRTGWRKVEGGVYIVVPERPLPRGTPIGRRYLRLANAVKACQPGYQVRLDRMQLHSIFPWIIAEHFPVVHPSSK